MKEAHQLVECPNGDRLAEQKRRLESEAATAKDGPSRDSAQKRIRQLDIAEHLDEWLNSPGLRSPR